MKGLISIVVILLFLFSCTNSRNKVKPNIIFITTDCQSWEDIPSITPALKMPALEKLTNESVVFTNHYSVAPISVPARYSIISGRYPHYHKMMDDGGNWLPENTPLLMEKLSESGYKTVGIGKMNFRPWERKAGFDFRIIADGQGNSSSDTLKHDDYYFYLKKAGLTRWDYLKHLNNEGIFGIYQWPLNDTLDIDYFVGNETTKILKGDKLTTNSPWFLWVSFNGPHYPWDSPSQFIEKYKNSFMPEARCTEDELNNKPYKQFLTRYSFSRNIANMIDEYPKRQHEIVREIRTGHFANLSQIDEQIGNILIALKSRKDFDNTIIVFTSINGALLGDHNNFQAGNFYERSSHVPFIVNCPGHFKKRNVTGFSSHVDIFPTFMELAGCQLPDSLEGKSMLPILKGEQNGEKHSFIEILNNYAVVTSDYKLGLYTPYIEGELYDRKVDPNELNNVYNNIKYKKVVDSLTNLLIGFNPAIIEIMKNRIDFPPLVSAVELKSGDNLRENKVPFFPGNPLKLLLDVNLEKNSTGPIITYDIDNTHGFSLFIEKGLLYFGIRKFEKEFDYYLPIEIARGRYKIKMTIDTKGMLKVSRSQSGKESKIQTSWPLPLQPGHPECFPRTLSVGISGDGWIKPYGNLERGANFKGTINSCLISVDNR